MQDGTKLFNKYHAWVNPEFMLARCYLGMLDAKHDDVEESDESEEDGSEEEVAHLEKSDGRERDTGTSARGSRVASSTRESRFRDPDNDLREEFDALRVAEVEE